MADLHVETFRQNRSTLTGNGKKHVSNISVTDVDNAYRIPSISFISTAMAQSGLMSIPSKIIGGLEMVLIPVGCCISSSSSLSLAAGTGQGRRCP